MSNQKAIQIFHDLLKQSPKDLISPEWEDWMINEAKVALSQGEITGDEFKLVEAFVFGDEFTLALQNVDLMRKVFGVTQLP